MERQQIRGACPHDCPDTCGIITDVEDGVAVGFRGDADNPISRGWLCGKVRPYLEQVYHPERVLYPLRRVGSKGGGNWQRVTWDEAVSEIASRWKTIVAESGAEAILPYSFSGTLGLVQMTVSSARLWNRLGASQLQRSICGSAAQAAINATIGKCWSPPYQDVIHSRLVILWGHNPISTAPHFMPFLRQAQHNGCQVIVIDPHRTQSAKGADRHLALRPGTDGELAMGLAHVLASENLHDEQWLNRHTIGWLPLRERLADFLPQRVAQRTGLTEEDIVGLARLYAQRRPSLIKIADGINRNRNGGQNVRAICVLPAMTGQYGVVGGGLSYSTSDYAQWDEEAVNHWRDCPAPGRLVNMNRLGAALMGEVVDPPIRSLYVFGANPATSSPNARRIFEGLRREDLFTVVHEQFLTDTADYADIVLPCTTQLEQTDLHRAYGTSLLTYNRQAISPRGECKSDWDVMRLLASALGFTNPWLHQSADEVIEEVLAATAERLPSLRGITLDLLRESGFVAIRLDDATPFAENRFPTPSGKVELFSQALADQGSAPLPCLFDAAEDNGGYATDDLPAPIEDSLVLLTAASHYFVSSSFANRAGLLKNAGVPRLEIHPDDAASRGIRTGDELRVFNGRGSCRLRAVVTDAIRPGVVASPKGRWAKRSGGSNVNWTTPDALGDLAGQSTFHSNRVWVCRIAEETAL